MEEACNEILVRVVDMSTVLKPSEAFALVLEEKGGERRRRLALIIGAVEAQTIRISQLGYRPPRPFTHDLMLSVMKAAGMEPVKGVISAVKNGIYYANLYVRQSDGTVFHVDARSTDVITLSIRAKFPLYVLDDVLEREQLRNISPDGSAYTVPVNIVDMETLKREMQAAVDREEYELASKYRDEIKRREMEEENCKEN
ncbi:bifunctional nuclease family protein [uncultured Phocaeicola sp.]|jgi:bifunctional DNase/RNase|uniref:bifunctional nuclease family protein n=1 Tax=uncultured Phocaeicola sp. TaxID=990718 RepID=UPI0015B2C05D|nr:bifunctional nuclease family protein [uncultured Phocaeicola sp.]